MPITNFDKKALLLPMTGANNGTVFTDYSLRQKVVTRTGVVTSTGQSKFAAYSSSGYFSGGTGQHLAVASDEKLTLSSKDFCVQFYCYVTSLPGTGQAHTFCGKGIGGNDTRSWYLALLNSGGTHYLRFAVFTAGTGASAVVYDVTHTIALNQWVHLAFVRNGTNWLIFVDGTAIGSPGTAANPLSETNVLRVGAAVDIGSFVGYMQDFSLTVGDPVYTGGFTPPDRMTGKITRTNTGVDSHEYDRALLFDWSPGDGNSLSTSVTPDSEGDFVTDWVPDLEYGVAFIKDGCGPVCRGPVGVDPDA